VTSDADASRFRAEVDSQRLDAAYRADDHQHGPVSERTNYEVVGEWLGAAGIGIAATVSSFAAGPFVSIPIFTGASFIGAVGGHSLADQVYETLNAPASR
jgi:hypothetical protein